MKKFVNRLRYKSESYITDLDVRQRFFVLLGVGILIFFVLNFILIQPVYHAKRIAKAKVAYYQRGIRDAQMRIAKLKQGKADKKKLEEQQKKLTMQIQKVDEDIMKHKDKLVDPQEVARMLTSVLSQQKHLSLHSIKNVAGKILVSKASDINYYQHGLVMSFTGDYFSTRNYLKSIESLSWPIYWDTISYSVSEYPNANVNLHVHTYSTEKGWIGG